MTTNEYEWLQVNTSDFKWIRVTTSDYECQKNVCEIADLHYNSKKSVPHSCFLHIKNGEYGVCDICVTKMNLNE